MYLTYNDIIPLTYTVHTERERESEWWRGLERWHRKRERERECKRVQESEKERFKSLVKLWDSSRSSYATVRHTHTHTHAMQCWTWDTKIPYAAAQYHRIWCIHLVQPRQRRHTITWRRTQSQVVGNLRQEQLNDCSNQATSVKTQTSLRSINTQRQPITTCFHLCLIFPWK